MAQGKLKVKTGKPIKALLFQNEPVDKDSKLIKLKLPSVPSIAKEKVCGESLMDIVFFFCSRE